MTANRVTDAQLVRACTEAPIGIQWVAPDGAVLWANHAATELMGDGDAPFPQISAIARDTSGRLAALLARLRAGERAGSTVAVIDGPAGGKRHLRVDAACERDDAARTVRCFTRDVTATVEAEEAVAEADKAAVNVLQLKAEFLSNISHELRTPLNGIIGFTELALDAGLDAEPREYLEETRACAQALATVVDDLLQLSSLDAGGVAIAPVVLELPAFIETVVRGFAAKAAAKGIELVCDVGGAAPPRVLADPAALRRALTQLLENAIKFTDAGKVVVTVSAETRRGRTALHIAVADTGVGIPADRQDVITQPFVQADGSSTRRYGGLGIGLAIVDELVTVMGGRLWVESRIGEGSTFHFAIPVELPQEECVAVRPKASSLPADRARQAARAASALRVLVAEDDPGSRLIAARSLERRGHLVCAVENGKEALKALAHDRFDVVLMDVQMPEMDGLTAASAIRGRSPRRRHTPIVALTGHAMPGDRERCLAAGMDAYVTKPVNTQTLVATVEGVARAAS